jgi:spermidine synthase
MFWLLVCFACSGASGLIYEVAWVRSLELIFGTTTFAVATVLASFMGGLAVGSYCMGRLSTRFERFHPLRFYAVLECLIALLALLIPVLLSALVPIYQWTWKLTHASFITFSLVRFALSALVLLVPTFLMGATLPVVSNFVGREKQGERRIGLLYSFNTLGAVLGCLAAGLILFPTLGLAGTQKVAMVFNLVAAIGAFWLARSSGAAATSPASSVGQSPGEASILPPPVGGREKLLVLLYAVSGFAAMLYEVAWSRVLVLVVGSSTYAYTIMLGTFLLGLALGAWLMTRFVSRFKYPLALAGAVQVAVAFSTFLSVYLIEELPYLYLKAYEGFEPSPRGLLGVQFLLASGLMILPTIGLGAMFPVTMHGLCPQGRQAGRVVGWAYALNTVGAIAGSVVAGFFLVPLLGSQATLFTGIAMNMGAGAIGLVALRIGPDWWVRWRVAVALLLVVSGGVVFASLPPWNAAVLTSGVFRYARDYVGLDRKSFQERVRRIAGEILMFDEGLTCTVTVTRTPESVTLQVNGKPDASTPSGLGNPLDTNAPAALYDLPTQILLGQLPLMLAPKRDNVLVIGLGSGLTVGSVLTHPVKHVDCLELEDAVVKGSRFFEDYNGRPLSDPRTKIIVNDARNHLVVSDESYDVIISEPSNPWIPGAANLFTRESFEIGRRRLNGDGVFCQWLQLYELQAQDFATVLRTFTGVFPYVHLFRVEYDAILVGSMHPHVVDETRLRDRWTDEVKADLERIDVHSVEDFLARYWIGGDELRQCTPPGSLNTDDNMLIEFAAPLQVLARKDRSTGLAAIAALFDGRTSAAVPHVRLSASSKPEQFWASVSAACLRIKNVEALIYARHSLGLRLNPTAVAVQVDAWLAMGRLPDARKLARDAEAQFPDSPEVLRALTRVEMREQKWAVAGIYAERWRQQQPTSPQAIYAFARCQFQRGDDAAARETIQLLDPALARREEFRDLPFYVGVLQARAGQYPAAIENLNSFLRRVPTHVEARTLLATALERAGRGSEAAIQWQKISVLNIRESEKMRQEALQLWKEGKSVESIAKLSEAVKLDPSNDELVIELARAWSLNGDSEAATRTLREYLAWNPDRATVVGYLSQILAELRRDDEARLMEARYRALTGGPWTALR